MSDANEQYDASNVEHIDKRKRRAKFTESQRLTAVRGIMSVPEGRRWMWEVLEMCHVHHTSFTTNGLTTAFKEGERNVGLRIEADIMTAAPESYMQMVKEAKEFDE